jgi:hypothetical protein
MKKCAYCGVLSVNPTREHVVPKSIYPKEARNQLLTVVACEECNHGWSDDEAHFRNLLSIAGELNSAVRTVYTKVRRSFGHLDGRRRWSDLYEQMHPFETEMGTRYMVYPASDQRFVRVLRKIVRGLHFHHFETLAADDLIEVDVLKFHVPDEFTMQMRRFGSVPEIFEYTFETFDTFEDMPMSSAWLLTFYKSRKFIAVIHKKSVTL